MEDHNLEEVEVAGFRDVVERSYSENNPQFIEEIINIAQKAKSKMKSFCYEADISDEQCEEIKEYARIHAEANTFNTTSMISFQKIKATKDLQACSCGCRKGVGQSLSIWMNQQNLTFLGPGILLFYFFLKHVRMTLILLLMSYGVFSITTSMLSSSITQSTCSGFFQWLCNLNLITTFNLKEAPLFRHFQLWMGFFLSILWFFSMQLIMFLGLKKNQQIDHYLESASDYTIRIENLPSAQYNERQLIAYLKQLWQTRYEITPDNFHEIDDEKIKLKGIQIIYNMGESRRLISEIQQLSLELEKMINEKNMVDSEKSNQYKQKKKQLQKAFKQIEQLRNQFTQNQQIRTKISTSCTLVEFQEEKQQKQFLKIYGKKQVNFLKSLCEQTNTLKYMGKEITIGRAPQPSDIIWANCEIEFSYLRYAIIWGITILILYSAYALISYLQTTDFVQNSEGIMISIILQIFNRIIWLSLSWLVSFQYQNTKTQSIISLMKKSIFAQVINVIVTPIVNMYVNQKTLYGERSLSEIVLNFQFVMFFMMFVFYVLNPTYYWKEFVKCIPCLRNRMIRNLCQVVGEIDTTDQIRPVLTYYEGPQFPIAGAYVYMITAIFHTLFYCHVQPFLLLIVICNLTGFHLILKYLLFRRCKIPQLTDVQIFKLTVSVMSYGSAFFGAGSLFFIIIEKDTVNVLELIPSSLALIVFFVLFLNPCDIVDKVNNFLFYIFTFDKDFNKSSDKTQKVNDIVENILFTNLEEKVSYERKQSYYKHSNAHKLFNYQSYIKELADEKSVQRIHALQRFCQSFFNEKPRSLKDLTNRKSYNAADDLMQVVLMPSLQLKKTKKFQNQVTTQAKETQARSNTEFKRAQQILATIFNKK